MQKILQASSYQAIIFDLGGVLLNIDYQSSKKAFEALGIADFDLHFSQLSQSHLFDRFETGKISAANFRKEIKKASQISCSDAQIDEAWNAMLLDFPIHRIEVLEELAQKIPLYLFSNTNVIHISVFKERLKHLGLLKRFEKAFKHLYYSYELGLRKPHPEGFNYILNENKLIPSRTLFIDDSPQHIEGAKKTGLQSYLLPPDQDILSVFKND